jgi:hypothetical protein
MRYLHFALVLVLTLIFLCAFVPAQPAGPKGGMVTVPEQGPVIEWATFEVGGMVLADPAMEDSLGHIPMIVLPEGAMLGIPYEVKDTLQTPRSQS